MLTANYLRTGKDLGDFGLPPPVSNLFDKQKFQYVASIDGLQTPMGVAVGNDGRIYVTETGGERKIHIYDSLWQETGSFAPPDTEASARIPVYLAIAPSGDVYVSDRGAATIYIFTADGESKGQVTAPAGFEDWVERVRAGCARCADRAEAVAHLRATHGCDRTRGIR